MSDINELWKHVPGYDYKYMVSSLGRVKSCQSGIWLMMTPVVSNRCYYQIGLTVSGKRTIHRLHQVVAMAFLNHIPNGKRSICVDHIDNDPLNNRLDNLQIITHRENTSKDRKHGKDGLTGAARSSNKLNPWRSEIMLDGKSIHLGYHKTKEQAAHAYSNRLREYEQSKKLD